MFVARTGRWLSAALLRVAGHGLACQPELVDRLSTPAPEWPRDTWRLAIAGDDTPAARGLTQQLTSAVAEAVARLLKGHKRLAEQLLAVGVCEPGAWRDDDDGRPNGYRPLLDPVALAEQTDFNIVSGFPARDLAAGGRGGPLDPLALWLLLRHQRRPRMLLDLGHSVRAWFLPRYRDHHAPSQIAGGELLPCGSLLDRLIWHLTQGTLTCDTGGKLAVQGSLHQALAQRLAAELPSRFGPPAWNPRGLLPERALLTAVSQELGDISLADRLCTTTRVIAQSTAEAVRRLIPPRMPPPEVYVTGGATHNGLLLNQLERELTDVELVRFEDRGLTLPVVEAAAAGMLAVLALDQTPANLPHLTGSRVGRVLGQVTPGSPWHWHRLLRDAGQIAGATTLRSAV